MGTSAGSLFAYGTLMFPEVWQRVVGRECASREAKLTGYAVLRVTGYDFPGLVPADESKFVNGMLFEGLTEEEFAVLDEYESSLYERVLVSVQTCDGAVDAFVYLVKSGRRGELTDERWDPKHYRS